MLRQVAEGVLIHESEFMQSNAVVVQGRAGVLLVDAGVHADEVACLASDLRELGQTVVAGFSTHPHWDHLLWHARLGSPPRYGTARCAAIVRDRLSDANWKARIAELIPPDIAEQVPLDLFGLISGLSAETARIPWDGPQVRIIEHQAHAPGHAAVLIEERGVLVAGDMLSDVLIPMLNLNAADPVEDYRAALQLLEGVAGDVDVLVPGHGRVTGASAELIRYVYGSTRIGRTCRPCVTPVFRATRGSADRPRSARIGYSACMNDNYSTSPEEESAAARPDRDPLARHADGDSDPLSLVYVIAQALGMSPMPLARSIWVSRTTSTLTHWPRGATATCLLQQADQRRRRSGPFRMYRGTRRGSGPAPSRDAATDRRWAAS